MSVVPEIAAALAVVLVVALLVVSARRRRRSTATWIDELAAARQDGAGVLAVEHEAATEAKLAGRSVAGPPGTVLREYGGRGLPFVRVEGAEHTVTTADATLTVAITRGSVWYVGDGGWGTLVVRTAAGEVRTGSGEVLTTCEADGCTYVLCFAGAVDVAVGASTCALAADQAARLRCGGTAEIVRTAPGALEGDEVVRLHRRLDRSAEAERHPVLGAAR